jgi:hypothetical protein
LVLSPEVVSWRKASQDAGLGGRTLPVLRRKDGPGNKEMAARIISTLNDVGIDDGGELRATTGKDLSDSYLVGAPTWLLHTAGAGRSGRLWRKTGDLPSVDVNSRMSYSQVTALAGGVLQGKLGSLLGITSTDTLRPLSVSYVGIGGSTPDGSHVESRVLGSLALYGRTVNGVPVVGGGGVVQLGFDTTGHLFGFQFDWSQYEAVGDREVLCALRHHGDVNC